MRGGDFRDGVVVARIAGVIVHHDIGASFRQLDEDPFANPARGSGDDGGFAF